MTVIITDFDYHFIFRGIPSSAVEKDILTERKFVHITGLPMVMQGLRFRIGERMLPSEYACWGHTSDKMTMVVLSGGEIWLSTGQYHFSADEEKALALHRGKTEMIPPLNREVWASLTLILDRVRDPYSGIAFPE